MKMRAGEPSLDDLADEELVEVFKRREVSASDAYTVLVHRHQPELFRRCRARLGTVADAEEAVQETLLRMLRGLPRFRGDAAFRTWLFAIADNQCNTAHLRRSRQVMSENVRALIMLHDEVCRSDPGSENRMSIAEVREVLFDLPNQACDVLMLRFYRDLSLEDIAKTLGIGLSAAKMRLYRALAQFQTAFEKLFGASAALYSGE